jgi:hypothetical protein
MRTRLHNVRFLAALAVIAAATAWALHAREPGLLAPRAEVLLPAEETADGTGAKEPQAMPDTGTTREQIKQGRVSREPARYWHKEAR